MSEPQAAPGTRHRIRAQASAQDPAVMGFVLDTPIAEGRTVQLAPEDDSPLGRALFTIGGLQQAEVSGAAIRVRKDDSAAWATLKPAIATAIRTVLDASANPLGEDASGDAAPDPDDALHAAVRDLLEAQINPSVAAHGGHIAVERVENGTVYLRMSGGCQGCAASAATLRDGVERMLRAALPQIGGIVDLTDHEAGDAPFYARAEGPSPVFNRPVPPDVITREDGHVSVDPEFLAPRLGLTPDTLRKGLQTGEVVGVIESGEGADAGKTRIVLRSTGRAWAAEMDANGAAHEIPPPKVIEAARSTQNDLADRVRAHLDQLDPGDARITYGALARALGLWVPGSVRRVTQALEATMREDASAGRPFIAARAVNRGADALPGKGFFDLATALGRGPDAGQSTAAFHATELDRLAKSLPHPSRSTQPPVPDHAGPGRTKG